jgi:hypothetical protein
MIMELTLVWNYSKDPDGEYGLDDPGFVGRDSTSISVRNLIRIHP